MSVPRPVSVLKVLLSVLAVLLLAEGIVRSLDLGALPRLRLFVEGGAPGIGLKPSSAASVRNRDGRIVVVRTDRYGLRVVPGGPDRGGWLAAGDEQVLGPGVRSEEHFAALLAARGTPVHVMGVPGYGVGDAVRLAESLLDPIQPRGVVFFVDQSTDWEEEAPITERMAVVGGWLLDREDATGPLAAVLGSPLARLHLVYYAEAYLMALGVGRPAPEWVRDPAGQSERSRRMAQLLDGFAARHPDLPVLVAFLPADFAASPERAGVSPYATWVREAPRPPWEDTTLRDQLDAALALPLVDLKPDLGAPDAWIRGDRLLSPVGHHAVAERLAAELQVTPGHPRPPG